MNVYYWTNFYKKVNSTRQPASTGTTAIVRLKEPTSFWHPEIEATNIPKNANYFKVASGIFTAYDAYYFVDDVISDGAETVFKLTLDPMATYKTLIGTTSAHVLRTNAPSTFNTWITDELNPPTNAKTVSSATTMIKYGTNLNVFDLSQFRFLISTVGAVASIDYALNNGIAKTYVLSGGTMALLASKLCSVGFLDALVNEFTNPMESILRCVALPVNMSGMDLHGSEPIFFGSVSTGIMANVLLGRVLISEVNLNVPTDMTGQQTYLNRSPYCTATIYLPFVGVCPLDVDVVSGYNLNLRTIIDCFTGDVTYSIKHRTNGTIYQTFSGKCGTDMPVASTNFSAFGAIGGALTAIGGIASKNPIMAASGVLAAAQSLESHTQINGGYSSVIGGWQGTDAIVTLYKLDPAHGITENAASEGLPYDKTVLINTLSGYVLCRNASVDIPGSDADKQTINGYLNSGFYYE